MKLKQTLSATEAWKHSASPRTHLRAVLFDLQLTLADYRPHLDLPVPEQVSRFLHGRGLAVPTKVWEAALVQVRHTDYPRYGYPDWERYLGRVFEVVGAKPKEATFMAVVREYQRARWSALPFAKEAVRRAKKLGLKTALVTSVPRFRFERDIPNVLAGIDIVVDGNTFHLDKSDPEIYVRTLNALRVRSEEAVMIGDKLQDDVLYPTRIGMRAILIHKEKPTWKESQAIGGNIVAKDLRQAMHIVGSWAKGTVHG